MGKQIAPWTPKYRAVMILNGNFFIFDFEQIGLYTKAKKIDEKNAAEPLNDAEE